MGKGYSKNVAEKSLLLTGKVFLIKVTQAFKVHRIG